MASMSFAIKNIAWEMDTIAYDTTVCISWEEHIFFLPFSCWAPFCEPSKREELYRGNKPSGYLDDIWDKTILVNILEVQVLDTFITPIVRLTAYRGDTVYITKTRNTGESCKSPVIGFYKRIKSLGVDAYKKDKTLYGK